MARLFNSGHSMDRKGRSGIKAISGYRGVVWQYEAICRHSMRDLKNKAHVDLKFHIRQSSSFIEDYPVGR
jgi:hypothetical protein